MHWSVKMMRISCIALLVVTTCSAALSELTVPATPEVTPLGTSPMLTFPIERSAGLMSLPSFAVTSDMLLQWDCVSPGYSLSYLPPAHKSGRDMDGVPTRLGLSLLGLPANDTVYTVEGIRIFGESDVLGANLNLIPFPIMNRLEVLAGPSSDYIGTGPIGGIVNAVFPGGSVDRRNDLSGSIIGIAGSEGQTGNAFEILDTSFSRSYAAGAVRLHSGESLQGFLNKQDAVYVRGSWYPEEFGLVDAFVLGGSNYYDDSDEDYLVYRAAYRSPEASFLPVSVTAGAYSFERTFRGHMLGTWFDGTDVSASIDNVPLGTSSLWVKLGFRSEMAKLVDWVEHERSFSGVFLSDELPVGGGVVLDFGAAVEQCDVNDESEVAGHIGAVWQAGDLTVRGRVARAYRFPSMTAQFESMADEGSFWRDGNVGLDRERSLTYILDTERKIAGNVKAGLSLYRAEIEDFNYLSPTSDVGPDSEPVFRWADGLDAYAEGLTLTISGGGKFFWNAAYTAIDSRTEADNMPAGYLPRHTIRLVLGGTAGRFTGEIGGEYAFDRVSPSLDRTYWYHMEKYFVLNVASTITLGDDIKLSLSATNLLDETVSIYEFGELSELPGRSFGVALKYSF